MLTKNHNSTFDDSLRFILVGNPNVGKSTLFNAITGDTQHTGNWTGKTIDVCSKDTEFCTKHFKITDLPGTYSLNHSSPEEAVTSIYIDTNDYDCIIIVANPFTLERSLFLTLQIIAKTNKAVLCLNMADEQRSKGLRIDTDELCLQIGIPVVEVSAIKSKGVEQLINTACSVAKGELKTYTTAELRAIHESDCDIAEKNNKISELSNRISNLSILTHKEAYSEIDEKLDKIFTSRLTGIPIMLLFFAIIFLLTAFGANYPSQWLGVFFDGANHYLALFLETIRIPDIVIRVLCDGVFTTVSWVVSVMLPPAAIFFPLFSILEESGYLARVAFNLDKIFAKVGVNGKLSLTMMMGLGCNACGVMGCRIVNSKKEKIISVVTNSFIPCNGRFPTLIAVISISIAGAYSGVSKSIITSASMMILLIISFIFTLITAYFLSEYFFKDATSSFIMELPSYKKPNLKKIMVNSFKKKISFVLTRAIAVSAPAGLLLWLFTNINVSDKTLINYAVSFFTPLGTAIGLDGVILTGFLLGFPANELVLPIIIMLYQNATTLNECSSLSTLATILENNNWTKTTAVCVCLFCLFHFPCSTTCLTIKKETNSILWTLISMLIPILTGIALCYIITLSVSFYHIFF